MNLKTATCGRCGCACSPENNLNFAPHNSATVLTTLCGLCWKNAFFNLFFLRPREEQKKLLFEWTQHADSAEKTRREQLAVLQTQLGMDTASMWKVHARQLLREIPASCRLPCQAVIKDDETVRFDWKDATSQRQTETFVPESGYHYSNFYRPSVRVGYMRRFASAAELYAATEAFLATGALPVGPTVPPAASTEAPPPAAYTDLIGLLQRTATQGTSREAVGRTIALLISLTANPAAPIAMSFSVTADAIWLCFPAAGTSAAAVQVRISADGSDDRVEYWGTRLHVEPVPLKNSCSLYDRIDWPQIARFLAGEPAPSGTNEPTTPSCYLKLWAQLLTRTNALGTPDPAGDRARRFLADLAADSALPTAVAVSGSTANKVYVSFHAYPAGSTRAVHVEIRQDCAADQIEFASNDDGYHKEVVPDLAAHTLAQRLPWERLRQWLAGAPWKTIAPAEAPPKPAVVAAAACPNRQAHYQRLLADTLAPDADLHRAAARVWAQRWLKWAFQEGERLPDWLALGRSTCCYVFLGPARRVDAQFCAEASSKIQLFFYDRTAQGSNSTREIWASGLHSAVNQFLNHGVQQ